MSRQFEVGDVVHIKSAGHLELQYGMTSTPGKHIGVPIRNNDEEFIIWTPTMFKLCGKQAVISKVCEWEETYTYTVKIDGECIGWSWSPQSFEEYDKEVEND